MVIGTPVSPADYNCIRLYFECFFYEGGRLWDLVMDILSEFDDSSSLKVSTGDGIINWDTEQDRGSLFLNGMSY